MYFIVVYCSHSIVVFCSHSIVVYCSHSIAAAGIIFVVSTCRYQRCNNMENSIMESNNLKKLRGRKNFTNTLLLLVIKYSIHGNVQVGTLCKAKSERI